MPQHRFASIHVVGTNGKSSVASMCAALLRALRVRSTVGLGRVAPAVEELARRFAAERHARLVRAAEPERAVSLHAPGDYLRRNFAVAEAAVAAAIGDLERERVREAAAALELH